MWIVEAREYLVQELQWQAMAVRTHATIGILEQTETNELDRLAPCCHSLLNQTSPTGDFIV